MNEIIYTKDESIILYKLIYINIITKTLLNNHSFKIIKKYSILQLWIKSQPQDQEQIHTTIPLATNNGKELPLKNFQPKNCIFNQKRVNLEKIVTKIEDTFLTEAMNKNNGDLALKWSLNTTTKTPKRGKQKFIANFNKLQSDRHR